MSHPLPADRSPEPVTVSSMAGDLRALGVAAGDTVLVHASLSSLGWVCGGAPAVVDALQDAATEDGTLVMPTHSPGNRDPAEMDNPPVPETWYETVRAALPPYRPAVTPTQGVGAIAECFRSYPGVHRSEHPQHSFAAWGADASTITADHAIDRSLGEGSPLAGIYDLEGHVVFLGTAHGTNTSLHLAESRADLEVGTQRRHSVVLRDGERTWVRWDEIAFDDADFQACGEAFEAEHLDAVERGTVGMADAKRLEQPALVDFAVEWFEAYRA